MKRTVTVAAFVLSTAFLVTPGSILALFDHNLRYGDRGPRVVALQQFLKNHGLFVVEVTGNFYSITIAAVKAFQAREGVIPVSGFFGPLTRTRANAVLFTTSDQRMQPSATLAQKSTDAAEVITIAQQRGYVSVMVQFAPTIQPGPTRTDAAALASLAAQVAAAQDAIIATHFGSSATPTQGQGFQRGITRFEITPGFIVNVNAAELEALAADPRVLHIHYNRAVSP